LKNFVKGVDKLLKPNGVFAFTDFRTAGELEQLEDDLKSFNMVTIDKIVWLIFHRKLPVKRI